LKARSRELRKAGTSAEELLWDELRNGRLGGIRFRRQHPIDPFVVDFYCAKAKLVIELDGRIHIQQTEEDAARQENLEQRGLRVIRFKNEEIVNSLETAVARIRDVVEIRITA
jgi:very-short-patch-repair endonuclease